LVAEAAAARGKVVRLRDEGRRAQDKFARVHRDTEQSWRTTFRMSVVDELRDALGALRATERRSPHPYSFPG